MSHIVIYENEGKKVTSFYINESEVNRWKEYAKIHDIYYTVSNTNIVENENEKSKKSD